MWNLKENDTNELISKTEKVIDIENKLMVCFQTGKGNGGRDKLGGWD